MHIDYYNVDSPIEVGVTFLLPTRSFCIPCGAPPPVHEGHYSHPRTSTFEKHNHSQNAAFGECSALEWWEAAEVNGGRIGAIKDELSSSLKSSPHLLRIVPSIFPSPPFVSVLSYHCSILSSLHLLFPLSRRPCMLRAWTLIGVGQLFCSQRQSRRRGIALMPSRLGIRIASLVALAIFLIASIICATAQNIDWLITGRVVCFEYPICPDAPSPRAAVGGFCGFLLMIVKISDSRNWRWRRRLSRQCDNIGFDVSK